jgi:hypothetical protein
MDMWWSLFLRGSTVVLDLTIITSGIFVWLQIKLRKKVKKIKMLGRKRLIVVLYIADTIAMIIAFLFPYIARLFLLLRFKKITNISFIINSIIGIIAVVLIAFLLKKITKRITQWSKKIQKKWLKNE